MPNSRSCHVHLYISASQLTVLNQLYFFYLANLIWSYVGELCLFCVPERNISIHPVNTTTETQAHTQNTSPTHVHYIIINLQDNLVIGLLVMEFTVHFGACCSTVLKMCNGDTPHYAIGLDVVINLQVGDRQAWVCVCNISSSVDQGYVAVTLASYRFVCNYPFNMVLIV